MFDRYRDQYRISYDPDYDILEIRVIAAGAAVTASEIRPNIFIHRDEKGDVSGYTILRYSETLGNEKIVIESPSLPENVRELVPA